jgi:hypothetical protein
MADYKQIVRFYRLYRDSDIVWYGRLVTDSEILQIIHRQWVMADYTQTVRCGRLYTDSEI